MDTIDGSPLLEDLRNHSLEQLAELRALLNSGAKLHPDPRRRGFLGVEGRSQIFYILRYPSGTKVLLVAVWDRNQASKDVDAAAIEKERTTNLCQSRGTERNVVCARVLY